MKKIIVSFVLCMLVQASAWAKINVVTTTSDLGYLAEQVGGDLVTVKSLARGDQNVHFLEPKPSFVLATSKADLFIHNGLELEIGWAPVLLTQSKNPKVQNNQPGNLDASEGVRVIEVPTGAVDRSMGDVHPQGNPHYLLDPHNALIVAAHIAKRLEELDPSQKTQYENNLASFTNRLRQKINQWEKEARPLKGQGIVTYHKTFNYLMEWLGIVGVGYLEPKPGLPPTSAHLVELINLIKDKKIRLIVTENYYDPKPGHEMGEKTGVKAIDLPAAVGGTSEASTYEALIDTIINHLLKD